MMWPGTTMTALTVAAAAHLVAQMDDPPLQLACTPGIVIFPPANQIPKRKEKEKE